MGKSQHHAGLHYVRWSQYGKNDDLNYYNSKATGGRNDKGKKEDSREKTAVWFRFQNDEGEDDIQFIKLSVDNRSLFIDNNGFKKFKKVLPDMMYQDYCGFIRGEKNEYFEYDFFLIFRDFGLSGISREAISIFTEAFLFFAGERIIKSRIFPDEESFGRMIYDFMCDRVKKELQHGD